MFFEVNNNYSSLELNNNYFRFKTILKQNICYLDIKSHKALLSFFVLQPNHKFAFLVFSYLNAS